MSRKISCLAMAALFFLALVTLYEAGLINSILVRSMCRDMCVPVALWAIVLLYAVSVHLLSFRTLDRLTQTLKKAVVFGFLLHLYLMLFGLVAALTKDHSFLSGYYFYYIKLVLMVFTFGISFSYALSIARLRQNRSEDAICRAVLFAPLAVLPAYFIVSRACQLGLPAVLLISAPYLLPYLFTGRDLKHFAERRIKPFFGFFVKNDRNFIVFVFALALILRCAFSVNIILKTETGGVHNFVRASDDGDTYDNRALKYLSGETNGRMSIWGGNWDEGYSIFLAFMYRIFGRNFYAVTMVQSFLGALVPVMIFLIGKLLFSRSAGMVAAAALALKGPLIFLSAVLGHEALWIPLLVFIALMLTRYYRSVGRVPFNMAACGIALGVVCVLRPLFIYFIPFLLLWVIVLWKNKPMTNRLKSLAVFIVVIVITLYSFSAAFKSPLGTGSTGRLSGLWDHSKYVDPSISNRDLSAMGVNFTLDPAGSLKRILNDPARFLSVAARIYPARIFLYFETYQFGFFDPIYLINSARWPNDFMPAVEFYFIVFFIYGLWLCLRKADILRSPVFLILAFNVFIYAIIFCVMAPRYRDSSTPFVYLIGGYGVVSMFMRTMRR